MRNSPDMGAFARLAIGASLVILALVAAPCIRIFAAFPTLQPPFEQQDFLTGFPNNGFFGPTGIVFYPNGDILVADAADGNLYRFKASGGPAGTPFAVGGTAVGLAFTGDGKLYADRRSSGSIVQLNPDNGEVIRTVASGFSDAVEGLAADPKSTALFVVDQRPNKYASAAAVFRVDPASGAVSVALSGSLLSAPDGLTFDTDGTLYVANEQAAGDIIRVDRQGNASKLVALPGGPDGIAVGKPGGSLSGSLLVNRNDGVISRVDLTTDPISVSNFASGGSRGDFVAVSPDGYMFATQTDRVVKFSPASFQVAVGGTRSALPLRIYSGIVAAALLVGATIGLLTWRRRRAIVRAQLAVIAANPTEVTLPEAPQAARTIPGISSATAVGRLVERLPDGQSRMHEIGDGSITIGTRDCSITLPVSSDVAAFHARVSFQRGRYVLHHTGGARFATLVSGKAAEWVTLEPGDEVQIGAHRFVFEE